MLGGTSSINGMVYMRGTPADYDDWRQRGCEGWDWDSVLPFFKKAEDQERGADEFHGVGGPLHVSNPVRSPLGDAMVAGRGRGRHPGQPRFQRRPAGRRRLLPDDDHQPPALELGAGLSAAGAQAAQNLTVATNAHATRILIEDGRAVGVEYRTPHGLETARARGEIIVSGGVYGSPQLLQLSGLGPADLLQRASASRWCATCRASAANLHDHFNTYLVCRCPQPVTVNDLAMSPPRKLMAAVQYAFSRSGHLSNAGIYAGALVRSDPRLEQPDLQINMSGWSAHRAAAHRHQAAPVLGLHLQPGASAPGGPRHGADQEPRPAGAAGDPVQLPAPATTISRR